MRGTGRAVLILLSVVTAVLLASGAALAAQTTADEPTENPPKAEKAEGDAANVVRPNPARTKATGPETAPPEGSSGPELSREEKEKDEEASLARDAREIASQMGPSGVSEEEALRRLKLQRPAGRLNGRLTEEQRATFAGTYIDNNAPEFRVVVRLTEGGLEKVRTYVEGGPLEGLVDVEPADTTLEELRAAQRGAHRAAKRLGVRIESGIRARENAVNVRVADQDNPGQAAFDKALREVNAPRPDKVDELEVVEELSQPKVKGGTDLESDRPAKCTSGYSVYDNASALYAQTTAAHCDPYSYSGDPNTYYAMYYRWAVDGGWYYIRMIGGWYGGSYDIQWHETPGDAEEAAINDRTSAGYRFIYRGVRAANQVEGETVCQSGQVGGYACGFIYQKGVTASPPNSSATYIEVQSANTNMCRSGDSGGPYFSGGSAYGTLVSGNDFYYPTIYCQYMPMDYVYESNLSLVTK